MVSEHRQRTGWVGTVAVAVALLSCLFIQRNSYKDLQSAKQTYSRIVEFVERETPPGSCIVTDLWWFDQVTAALYPTRIVLFVSDAASTGRALTMLAGTPEFFVARSRSESASDALERVQRGGPFVTVRQSAIPERALVLTELAAR